MGLFKNFGKHKGSNDKPNKATKKNSAKEMKARNKAIKKKVGNLKQYPNVRGLKLPEVVPSAVLEELQEAAQNKDGLVRKISNPDGYLVLMFTEADMEKAGLKPSSNRTTDFGQMAASFSSNEIHSATLAANIAEGQVVIVPDRDTLDALTDFDCFNPDESSGDALITFHWGVYPSDVNDDDLDAKVEELDATLESGAWSGVLENREDIEYRPGAGKDAITFFDTIEGSDTRIQSDDDMDLGDDTPEEEPKMDEDTLMAKLTGGSSSNSQADAPKEIQDEPKSVQNTSVDEKPADIESKDNDNNAVLQGLLGNDASDLKNDKSSKSNDEFDGIDLNSLMGDVDSANFGSELNQDGAKEEPVKLTPNKEENHGNLNKLSRSKGIDQQEAITDFMSRFSNSVLQNSKDAEFGINVDMSRLDQYLKNSRPQQFELMPESESEDGLLSEYADNLRQNANATLRSKFVEHQKTISSEYEDRIHTVLDTIHQMLDMDNVKDNPYARKKQQLDQKYEQDLADVQASVKEQQEAVQHDYDKARKQFVDSQVALLQQSYDDDHAATTEATKRNILEQAKADLTAKHQQDVNNLIRQRNRKAQEMYDKLSEKVYSDAVDQARRMEDNEKELYASYRQQIEDTLNGHFDKNVEREKALAQRHRYEGQIQDLKAELQEAKDDAARQIKEYQDKVETVQRDATQSVTHAQEMGNERLQELQAQFQQQVEQTSNRHQQEVDSLNDTINDLQTQLNNSEANHQQEIKDLRNSMDEEKARIEQEKKDEIEDMRKKYTDSYEQVEKRSQQASHHTVLAGIVCAVIGGCVGGMGGMMIEQHAANNNQPQTEQVSSQHNDKHRVATETPKKATKGDVVK